MQLSFFSVIVQNLLFVKKNNNFSFEIINLFCSSSRFVLTFCSKSLNIIYNILTVELPCYLLLRLNFRLNFASNYTLYDSRVIPLFQSLSTQFIPTIKSFFKDVISDISELIIKGISPVAP